MCITPRLSDLVGADVGLHVGQNFLDAFPERTYPAGLIRKLNEAKRLGEKTGAGCGLDYHAWPPLQAWEGHTCGLHAPSKSVLVLG